MSSRRRDLLPPDICRSQVRFSVEQTDTGERKVRYALAALKNVGQQAMDSIVREREEQGQFKDLFDFANRLDTRSVNKKALENLAKAGAFDSLNPNRRQVFESMDVIAAHAASALADRESNQVSLFGDSMAASTRPKLRDVADWPQQMRLNQEFDAIGFYLSAHPLEAYAKTCRKLGVVNWRDVISGRLRSGQVLLSGIVGGRRIMTTSRGSKMAFVQMSDSTGSYEVTMFQEVLNSAMELLDEMEIDAVVVDADQQESVLLEITENLFRNELSVIDRAVFVQTYRDVWESKFGKIVSGPRPISANLALIMEEEEKHGFSGHVADRMGLSKRSFFRLNRIAQSLHSDLRAAVRGTPVADNQAALLKLAKMEPQEQRRAAIALRAEGGDLKKALGHVKAVRPTEKPEAKRDGMLKALLEIWSKADDATRKAFLAEIGLEDAA